ncbi:UNVERIFIED_CONTAM: hypothetical protein Sradi_3323900 [Sesamum radiatum]|uniref:Secreted protein n=1 Tax=Sesamum radiatum TaxID=300843 RepID=A0AAW2R1G4_SESRA
MWRLHFFILFGLQLTDFVIVASSRSGLFQPFQMISYAFEDCSDSYKLLLHSLNGKLVSHIGRSPVHRRTLTIYSCITQSNSSRHSCFTQYQQ